YLFGLAYVRSNSDFRPAFLDGNWSLIGFPDFFLRSFFYKTPLPMLGLLIMAAIAAILWQRRPDSDRARVRDVFYRLAPLWSLLLVYGAFAVSARLNIGHRHILPIYPVLFVSCGACAWFFRSRDLRWAAALVPLLVVWQIAEAIVIAPDYLAYFNEAAGGPRTGYKHLVDSSLDWGQDLPALKKLLDDRQHHPGPEAPIYLAYFGTGKPEHYGTNAIMLGNNSPTSDGRPEALRGGLYCISATTLQQVYARPMGAWAAPYESLYQLLRSEFAPPAPPAADPGRAARLLFFRQLRFARLCSALRHRVPIAEAGSSILLFDVSDAELAQALDGPPVELVPEPQVDGLDQLEARNKAAPER
ncbi:MAG: hypothetical protein M3Z64_00825, partial [Verrucomicrobiota bacterium]|nr:hypothetical protein [Verrucomicrobiota bacterium]